MKYNLEKVNVYFSDNNDVVVEDFKKPEDALEFIKESSLEHDKNLTIELIGIENRTVNSASSEDLDYVEEVCSLDKLQSMVDDLGTTQKRKPKKKHGLRP